MKYVLIVFCIVFIITALDLYISGYIENSAEKMLSYIQNAKSALQRNDMATATAEIKSMREEWESYEPRWEIYVDHRETERVDTLLTRLEAMAEANTPETMMPEFQELEFFLTHISDKQKFRPENIL
jgi:predicted Holliday junction resolvase-like endonuclease